MNISSPIHEIEEIDTCDVDGGHSNLTCPSFLKIYIRHTIYGRKAQKSEICTGEKDPAPSEDCLDTDVLTKAQHLCHGKSRCSIGVSGSLADLSATCNSNRKELKINYTCGKYFEEDLLLICFL